MASVLVLHDVSVLLIIVLTTVVNLLTHLIVITMVLVYIQSSALYNGMCIVTDCLCTEKHFESTKPKKI